MNLQFKNEKEQRAFELLQKYFPKEIAEHFEKVENLKGLIVQKGYDLSEIEYRTLLWREIPRWDSDFGGYVNGHFEIRSHCKTIHYQETISLKFRYSDINFFSKETNIQNEKAQNEAIIKQNQEIDELLNLME